LHRHLVGRTARHARREGVEAIGVCVSVRPPLICSTSPGAVRPRTRPPTVWLCGGISAQLTATLVTSALPIVPLPLATEQVWPAGGTLTVTAYPRRLRARSGTGMIRCQRATVRCRR
jgi:hypothetical protein